jgi:hypothetical protein
MPQENEAAPDPWGHIERPVTAEFSLHALDLGLKLRASLS